MTPRYQTWMSALTLAILTAGCPGEPLPPPLDTGILDDAGDADAEGELVDGDVTTDGDEGDTLDAFDADPDEDGALQCSANGNEILESGELVVLLDQPLSFRAPPLDDEVSVNLAGETEGDTTYWHFEQPVPGERTVSVEAASIEGTWYADDFPRATHGALLSEEYGYLGIYRLDDEALWLLGFVSIEGQGTNVEYDPPVPIIRFPLAVGDSWEVSTTGSGLMSYLFFYDSETYRFTADAFGTVVVPAGEFPVIRVRTELEQWVGLLGTERISYSFLAECWGLVANVVSRDDESELLFTTASDYRRLSYD